MADGEGSLTGTLQNHFRYLTEGDGNTDSRGKVQLPTIGTTRVTTINVVSINKALFDCLHHEIYCFKNLCIAVLVIAHCLRVPESECNKMST